MRLPVLLLAAALIWTPAVHAQDVGDLLTERGLTGTLVVERLSDGRRWTANRERAEERFVPASTFKIPNSLIILETGVVADPDTEFLTWDGTARGGNWDQDQNLRLGFARSAVWAYQEWARRVGHERMTNHVAAIGYGNGDIGPAAQVDQFWLTGPLEISAREEVDFLTRLHRRDLPFRAEVMETVIDLMERDRGAGWVLRGKSGWALRDGADLGWFVGWLETPDDVYVFALNIDMATPEHDRHLREPLARAALEHVTGLTLGSGD